MDQTTLKALESQADQTLAEWWCILNRWGWPKGLPKPEKRDRDEVRCNRHGNDRRWKIMCWIVDKIGHEACSREWNRDTMNADEHAQWYRKYRRGLLRTHSLAAPSP